MWSEFFNKPETQRELKLIRGFLREQNMFAPKPEEIFSIFNLLSPQQVKVVILGQDPYHGLNPDGTTQAMGIAFSVRKGQPIPVSLRNIYKEAGVQRKHGDLTDWVKQGVFLLNTALTVELHKPNSHTRVWTTFTDLLIEYLDSLPQKPIFVLWGSNARCYSTQLSKETKVLTSPHPSGLSAYRGFFGCEHFKTINSVLETPINW